MKLINELAMMLIYGSYVGNPKSKNDFLKKISIKDLSDENKKIAYTKGVISLFASFSLLFTLGLYLIESILNIDIYFKVLVAMTIGFFFVYAVNKKVNMILAEHTKWLDSLRACRLYIKPKETDGELR